MQKTTASIFDTKVNINDNICFKDHNEPCAAQEIIYSTKKNDHI